MPYICAWFHPPDLNIQVKVRQNSSARWLRLLVADWVAGCLFLWQALKLATEHAINVTYVTQRVFLNGADVRLGSDGVRGIFCGCIPAIITWSLCHFRVIHLRFCHHMYLSANGILHLISPILFFTTRITSYVLQNCSTFAHPWSPQTPPNPGCNFWNPPEMACGFGTAGSRI